MKLRALIPLWLVLVGLFAAYGFFRQDNQIHGSPFDYGTALDSTLIYGGIGFTLATCLAVIFCAVQRLRAKGISGFRAITFVFVSSAIAAFLPPLVVACSGRFTGEATMATAFVGAYTMGIGLLSFLLFDIAVLVLYLRRRDA